MPSPRRADERPNKHYNNKRLWRSVKDTACDQENRFQQSHLTRYIGLQILGEDQIYICAS
jgi:hypothetical protein